MMDNDNAVYGLLHHQCRELEQNEMRMAKMETEFQRELAGLKKMYETRIADLERKEASSRSHLREIQSRHSTAPHSII